MTFLRLLLAAVVVPIPIGVGPRYHPPPAVKAACRAGSLVSGNRVHLELFALRRVVIVPAGVGVGEPRLRYGRVVAAPCRAAIWTTEPTGVIRFTAGARLGDVFRIWGQPLDRRRLLSFRGRVRLYREGVLVGGDPRRLRLRDGDQLVLEVGGYVPPHPTFRFPR
ncbi:MAG: hypothetical protein ACTHKS_18570 [Gaiellaceae bacterium]